MLGTLEIVLRSAHLFNSRVSWARPDPIFGWRNIPGYTYWHFRKNDHPVTGYPENDIEDINRKTALSTLRTFYHVKNNDELMVDTSFNKTLEFEFMSLISHLKTHSAIISVMTERHNSYRQQMPNEIYRKSGFADNKINGALSLATAKPDPIYLENYKLNKL